MTPEILLEQLLVQRGYSDPVSRDQFLNPKYESLYNPLLMHDMEKAVNRIFLALKNNERICIYSDYDADGIPGAVIMHDFFKKIGYENFCNYIPHRHTEGYGLHRAAIEKKHAEYCTLMITIDLGITAVPEIAFANSLGMDVIVTDHHEPLEKLPEAFAIVNPKLGHYPDRMLCGAGVVFKLIQALLAASAKVTSSSPAEFATIKQVSAASQGYFTGVTEGWEKWLLDMAGLATLSDMVPLVNENRIIAYYGMKVLQKTQRPGLVALFERSGISVRNLTETDIVFSITPKLNAASRMSHPEDAFKALATIDRREGIVAAEHLTKLNDLRKKMVAKIMKDVHKRIVARKIAGTLGTILVIGDPAWSAGILGIIASKIIEEYRVTVFVWGEEAGVIKGSVRGIGDISVVTLMQSVSHLFTHFGGHEDAGGFSACRETIHVLETEFCKQYDSIKHEISREGVEIISDMDLDISDVTINHYRSLRQMAPFGMGNPKPIFAFRNIMIESVRQFGKTTEHLEVIICNPLSTDQSGNVSKGLRNTIRAISWYATPTSFTHIITAGETITLFAEFDYSVFRGKEELRLMIVDVLPCDQ